MAIQKWNDDYQSGMLFIGLNMKCDLLEYFSEIAPLTAIATKYGLEILDLDATEEGAFFLVPRGQEKTLAEKLRGDKIIGNVEYVLDGAYNLLEKLDGLHIGGDLPSDILSCSTKQEVNSLLERYIQDIEALKLK